MNSVLSCEKVFAHLDERDFTGAQKLLISCLQFNNNDFYAYYLLGWCYEKVGKKSLAQSSYAHAYKINTHFLDIDEKVHGYERTYENKNTELVNIIKWMKKDESAKNIDKIIAKTALNAAEGILNNSKTVKTACTEIFNEKLRKITVQHLDKSSSLIFELGNKLKNNSFLKPWEVYSAAENIKTVCLAVLDRPSFKKNILLQKEFNSTQIELIKRERITDASLLLQSFFYKACEDDKLNIIKTLGILGHEKSSFFLINYLKKAPLCHVYEISLALSRIGDKNILGVLREYLKKYSLSDLAPLLFVCLCRLEKGKDSLIELCSNANILIREEALTQLGDYKGKDVVKTLLQGLFDTEKVSNIYPVRFVAYEKLGELGVEYLKSFDNNFLCLKSIQELEKVFNEETPKIEWIYKLINSL